MKDGRVGMSFMATMVVLMVVVRLIAAMDMYAAERKVHRAQSSDETVRDRFNDEQRKHEAMKKLKEVLGIQDNVDNESVREAPPQFMMELYNTVTDMDGYTTRKNPFGAKIVRSFVEKEGSSSQSYVFNLSGLKQDESILAAELHLYRKRSPLALKHPSVLSSPYFLIQVFQILPDKPLDEPDHHKLLTVHYVGAYSTGWQVFNVKQAVLSWLSGESPNLGLLVSATTIFDDRVQLEFARREDDVSGKLPILVLFTDDSNDDLIYSTSDEKDENGIESEEKRRNKRHGLGQVEVPEYVEAGWPAHFHREKKHKKAEKHHKTHGFAPKQRSLEQTLSSMDIYERAMLREQLTGSSLRPREQPTSSTRSKREVDQSVAVEATSASECRKVEVEPCARRDLYVNFRDIGMTTIIAPEGYAAYQCRGHCKSPLSQDQKPTNHATIQGIINKMNLSPNQDVQMPCCVPVSLSSISILYHDNERDGVVLKSYTDMAVVSCGCR